MFGKSRGHLSFVEPVIQGPPAKKKSTMTGVGESYKKVCLCEHTARTPTPTWGP